jgi:predicted nucleotide-binding protein
MLSEQRATIRRLRPKCRSDFKMSIIPSPYKRLYGRLLRVGVDRYLASPSFRNLCICEDVDATWEDCVQLVEEEARAAMLAGRFPPGTSDKLRRCLACLINIEHSERPEKFPDLLKSFLKDFLSWHAEPIDPANLNEALDALQDLGYDEDTILVLKNSIRDNKILNSETEKTPAVTPPQKPRVFIGSSVEEKEIAETIQLILDYDADCTVWHQGVFGLSGTVLTGLSKVANESDFAILVLTPDDMVIVRGEESPSPRDNVLFELGFFIGALGLERTFCVHCRDDSIKIPSDLAGIEAATYSRRSDGNLEAALGSASTRLKNAFKKLGPKQRI